VHSLWGIAKQ